MCKNLTVAYADLIGKRLVGWAVYNGSDYSFLSESNVRQRIKQGQCVNGLKLGEDGACTIDPEFAPFIMGKSGLSFTPIMRAEDDESEPVVNKYAALVRVVKSKGGSSYYFITNRCGLEVHGEAQLKTLLQIIPMGGVKLDSKGKLVVHPSVEVVDTESEAG